MGGFICQEKGQDTTFRNVKLSQKEGVRRYKRSKSEKKQFDKVPDDDCLNNFFDIVYQPQVPRVAPTMASIKTQRINR